MAAEKEPFLERWSRLKREAHEEAERPGPPAEPAEKAPPELPPLDKLSFDSDYTGFLHPKVDEETRRAALKRLFSDPRFNVMDGLDVYIDDYSKPSPLPAEMLAGLRQAQRILDWTREEADTAKAEPAALEGSAPPALDGPKEGLTAATATAESPSEPAAAKTPKQDAG